MYYHIDYVFQTRKSKIFLIYPIHLLLLEFYMKDKTWLPSQHKIVTCKKIWQFLFFCQRQKHCWSYFAISQTRLVELVMLQGWYAWTTVSFL